MSLLIFDEQQPHIPSFIRQLFRFPEFKTKAARMGKVARVSSASIEYWKLGDESLHVLDWLTRPRKK